MFNWTAFPWGARIALVGIVPLALAQLIVIVAIPGVIADPWPDATPANATQALVTDIVLVILAPLVFVLPLTRRGIFSRAAVVVAAAIVLLAALWLLDGAFALREHGPDMRATSRLLFVSVAADVLGATLLLIGAATSRSGPIST